MNRFAAAFALLACAASGWLSGCNRTYYRHKADHEATVLIQEKSTDPRWALPGFSIELDPRSRYYSPWDPDFPPMPPDDPASHQYMHVVDGKKGYSGWDEYGRVTDLENPYWEDLLGQYAVITEDGAILLRLEDALRIALIHSTNYQEALETLYLSALDVSTERFRFDVQFFGGGDLTHTENGDLRGDDTLRLDVDGQWSRRLATAGEILVGFANTTVWNLDRGDSTFATSLLDFSLVQPLLRNGGRAIALEQLTIAERTLLSNLRAFQRFRQGFYTDLAIGQGGVGGPRRQGGFFGGTGLTGFTGQGTGGFGGVGSASGFAGGIGGGFGGGGAGAAGAGTGLAGGGAGNVGGFIGLLQTLQQIRNTRESLNAQLRTLALLEANLEAGLIDIAQVDQFRQSIETQRAQLLQAQNGLQSALDNFKRGTLGLPPDVPIELDDSFIEPFRLIPSAVGEIQADIDQRLREFGDLPRVPNAADVSTALDEVPGFRESIGELLMQVPPELEELEAVAEDRMAGMTDAEQRLFRRDMDRLREQFAELQERFEASGATLEDLREELTDENTEQIADRFVSLMTELGRIVGEAALIRARSQVEQITVEPIELDPQTALEVARANRLDWMNNRAALVDNWRLIEFNANRLKSDVTIRFDGDIGTVGDNPIDFRGDNSTLRARLQIDPPFTRLNERNNYRQQLIIYQQSRRNMIQFEDGVLATMRTLLRDLEQLRVNLEIQRRAVIIAIRRVDQTTEALNQPVPPAPPGQLPQAFGPTAAQNLLSALEDLRNVQNNLMSVWLNYYATRMLLYRELGVMQLDENGAWIDQPLETYIGVPAEGDFELPPPVPPEWLEDGGLQPGPEPLDDFVPLEPGPALPGEVDDAEQAGRAMLLDGPVQTADWNSVIVRDPPPGRRPPRPSNTAAAQTAPPHAVEDDRDRRHGTVPNLGARLRQRIDSGD